MLNISNDPAVEVGVAPEFDVFTVELNSDGTLYTDDTIYDTQGSGDPLKPKGEVYWTRYAEREKKRESKAKHIERVSSDIRNMERQEKELNLKIKRDEYLSEIIPRKWMLIPYKGRELSIRVNQIRIEDGQRVIRFIYNHVLYDIPEVLARVDPEMMPRELQ